MVDDTLKPAAEAAKQAFEVSKHKPDVGPLVRHVARLINEASAKGLRQVVNPLKGIRTPISAEQMRAVDETLAEHGYTTWRERRPDGDVVVTW